MAKQRRTAVLLGMVGAASLVLLIAAGAGTAKVSEDGVAANAVDVPSRCEIRGTQADEVLNGTPLRDWICGRGGDDRLAGLDEGDILDGGNGDDWLDGGPGEDMLVGGDGNDTLVGGPGGNIYNAGDGNDSVDSANGLAEMIDCGPGSDTAHVDPSDKHFNCETVT